jgi:ribonucleoside-diphosphate reductase alpha chain
MRALMTAGPALERDHIAGYNCAYLPIDTPRALDELFYILMCGTGVGFSVETQYVNKLPEIPEHLDESDTVIVVRDSKGGWARGFRQLVSLLYSGEVPKWDLSRVRHAGARLKTFGGRASGPDPLASLFGYTVSLFKRCCGRKLTSVECHDLVCRIADSVIVGGVRRSALISLGDITDSGHAKAKTGAWHVESPERGLSNNSAVYTSKPSVGESLKEWRTIYESKSGERGIFNRSGAQRRIELNSRRESNHEFGTNPCGEIILRPYQFCNLTEVIVRPGDTFKDLERKVRLASFLGTLQSTLTDFRHIRKIWKTNCEEERLLGVSLTGIMDHVGLSAVHNKVSMLGEEWRTNLKQLQQAAIDENEKWAKILGINPSTAITTVKPSGTVSQLTNSASGIHPRWANYYIRRIRMDTKDPLSQFLISQEVPNEPEARKPEEHIIFSFPQQAPLESIKRDDMTALEQLEHWYIYSQYWTEHNPSATIYFREDEWWEGGAWVMKHFDSIAGVSFLPHSEHIYKQAPYEEITKEEYEELAGNFPEIDWSKFKEEEDNVTTYKELACTAGYCEV